MPPQEPMKVAAVDGPLSPDAVVAKNLRLLRDGKHPTQRAERAHLSPLEMAGSIGPISRARLAKFLTAFTGRTWTVSRLIQLEHREGPSKAPKSAKWWELIDLAAAFEVPIYDLFLPPEGTEMDLTVQPDEFVVTDDGEVLAVTVQPDGENVSMSNAGGVVIADRNTAAETLLRIPAHFLTYEGLAKIRDVLADNSDTVDELHRMTAGDPDAVRAAIELLAGIAGVITTDMEDE